MPLTVVDGSHLPLPERRALWAHLITAVSRYKILKTQLMDNGFLPSRHDPRSPPPPP
jgi:hypothetical protein